MESSPLAYLITFRTHGTWLHGDPRGSYHATPRGAPTSALPPMPRLEQAMIALLRHPPVRLDPRQRQAVAAGVTEACRRARWEMHALTVQPEQVHVVVAAAAITPERVLVALKARATMRLGRRGGVEAGERVWSRHGSTGYLWTTAELQAACRNVEEHIDDGAGEPMLCCVCGKECRRPARCDAGPGTRAGAPGARRGRGPGRSSWVGRRRCCSWVVNRAPWWHSARGAPDEGTAPAAAA